MAYTYPVAFSFSFSSYFLSCHTPSPLAFLQFAIKKSGGPMPMQPSKRTRLGHKKSKNGCTHCKTRHVKVRQFTA